MGLRINNGNSFVVALMCLFAASIATVTLPRLGGAWTRLRRIPAMDVMDEAAKVCSEKGRPFLYSAGSLSATSGAMAEFVDSFVSVGRYLATQCAELGVSFTTYCSNAEVQMLIYDYVRQGYINAGKPEQFNGKNVIFLQGGVAQSIMEHHDFFVMQRPAAFIGLGQFGSGTPVPIFQDSIACGAFTIGSTYWPDELSQVAMSADYTLMTAEMAVVGCYVDNNAEKMSAFIGEDVAKLILIATCVGLGILWMAGYHIFTGF